MPTLADLQNALSPEVIAGLADDDLDGVPDAAVLQAAIDAADRTVRVATRIVGELPAALHDTVVTLAIERLYERRRETLPGPWRERANRARETLAAWRDGNAVRFSPGAERRNATRDTLDNL